MDARPSLSILIPTYGRARALERLLGTIVADPHAGTGGVTVLVSDNASPDDTAATVRSLQRQFSACDLRLHVQEQNLGPIGNIEWLAEHAPPTDYVWLLGDDDQLLPGAIGCVLDALAQTGAAVLHLPHGFDSMGGFDNVDSPCPSQIERFDGGRELLLKYHGWLSFLSATVVERMALLEAVHEAPTQNPWAPHIWFVVAGRDRPCAVAARKLVHGGGEPGWLDKVALYLTTYVIDAFDDGFRLVVNEHEFGRYLDARYRDLGGIHFWNETPIGELDAVVRRFPSSRLLRQTLWSRGVAEHNRAAILTVDAAARGAGDDVESAILVEEGERRFARDDLDAAAESFRAALNERPTNVEAWSDLGVVLHAQGSPGAGEAFDRALAADPRNPDALLNRASWCLSIGLFAQATEDARRLLAICPEHLDARKILAAANP